MCLQQQFSIVVRFAFNRFKDEKSAKEIKTLIKNLNNIELLDSWFIKNAVDKAEQIYKQYNNKKVIFGGRKNFAKRLKHKISSEEYKAARFIPLLLGAETLRHGNRKFELDIIDNNQIIFKIDRKTHIKLKLPKLKKSTKRKLEKLELLNDVKLWKNGYKYTVSLTTSHVSITFEDFQNTIKLNENKFLALDLNPSKIGLSVKENDKKIHVREFDFGALIDKIKQLHVASSSTKAKHANNKLKHELFQISKQIANIARGYQCKFIFIEDLCIKAQNHHKGKNFNRLINNLWKRNAFISNLEKRCKAFGAKLFKINPAYSSFIGNMQHSFTDSINSSLEIGRRGHDVIIKKNKKFYPELCSASLKDQWKEHLSEDINSWKELFVKIKNSKMMYRVSLEESLLADSKVFRLNSSNKVCVKMHAQTFI